eukprot:4005495-Prorocentrum_lima.AAC.1
MCINHALDSPGRWGDGGTINILGVCVCCRGTSSLLAVDGVDACLARGAGLCAAPSLEIGGVLAAARQEEIDEC